LVSVLRLTLLAILALAALSVVGCGGGEKAEPDVLLATVGEKNIMGSYYEDRLSLLAGEELPKGDDGMVMDMATLEGKERFLETLINKEVMAATAVSMGYDDDPQISGARESLIAYEAAVAMRADVVVEPANFISEEQLHAFYDRMGSSRQCRYLITNFIDQAREARQMAVDGADWDDVIAKYHDGAAPQDGNYVIDVPFGRYKTDYENAVFNIAIGEVTEPIETSYGYWVLKVDGEKPGKRPPLEEAKAQILDVTRGRIMAKLRDEFKLSIRDKYKFFIEEDALLVCYEGLPAQEELFYPGTKDAIRREDLQPLDVPTADREMAFYGYTTPDGTERLFSLGDYKTRFDNMSVFQRPKRSQMLGNLRDKLTSDIDRILINFASKDGGYYEHPDVQTKVNAKVEEMLVNKLYMDLVVIDKRVTREQMDAFWAEHEADYFIPETRGGRLVICADRASADAAYAAASDGMPWKEVLAKFGTDENNKINSGKTDKIRTDSKRPIRDAYFALNVGEVGPPFVMENGKFGVVKLEAIHEPYQMELMDISEQVGQRMKQIREEEVFQNLLAGWKEKLTIVTYPENLAGLKSWHDLTVGPTPENLVPRN
jgi:peptidyl-prolyl cis-trans isomerase C